VEAGLRSNDRSMPEEINRILTDQIADKLYTTERTAEENLRIEGIPSSRVSFVGNVMIDTLKYSQKIACKATDTLQSNGISPSILDSKTGYGVVTLHRPSNVDDKSTLTRLISDLLLISERLPLIFALHPRTRRNLEKFDLLQLINNSKIILLPPQGYLEMVGLMSTATLVLTDSGGLQEETTALGVPCITLRENTERPITIEQGTNTLVGTDHDAIILCVDQILAGNGKKGRVPELWDGHAAERIVKDLYAWLSS